MTLSTQQNIKYTNEKVTIVFEQITFWVTQINKQNYVRMNTKYLKSHGKMEGSLPLNFVNILCDEG